MIKNGLFRHEFDKRVLPTLLIGYILSLGFLAVFDLPIVGSKIQPPEVIFLMILGIIASSSGRRPEKFYPPVSDRSYLLSSILFYTLAVLLSCLFSNNFKSWFEFAGLIYLITLFLIFNRSFWGKILDAKKVLFHWLPISGTLAAILGILGWILTQYGIHTQLANASTTYYPYFGYIGRAKGFTTNPNMLMSILAICILLKSSEMIFKIKIQKRDWWLLAILFLGGILTFSKTLVVLAMALIFISLFSSKLGGNFPKGTGKLPPNFVSVGWMGILLFFLFFNFGTHIAIFDKEKIDWEALTQKAYTDDQAFAEIQGKYFIATNYWINKKSSLTAGCRNIPFGVGPGGQNEFVGKLKDEGKYPGFFTNYDPHSTYFGAFGELGVFGLFALVVLCFTIFKKLKRVLNEDSPENKALAIGLAACFFYIAIEAIATDVMNFRHYWVLIAALAFLPGNNSKQVQ